MYVRTITPAYTTHSEAAARAYTDEWHRTQSVGRVSAAEVRSPAGRTERRMRRTGVSARWASGCTLALRLR